MTYFSDHRLETCAKFAAASSVLFCVWAFWNVSSSAHALPTMVLFVLSGLFAGIAWNLYLLPAERKRAARESLAAQCSHSVKVPARHTLCILNVDAAGGSADLIEVIWNPSDGAGVRRATFNSDGPTNTVFPGPGTLRIKNSSGGGYPRIAYELESVA